MFMAASVAGAVLLFITFMRLSPGTGQAGNLRNRLSENRGKIDLYRNEKLPAMESDLVEAQTLMEAYGNLKGMYQLALERIPERPVVGDLIREITITAEKAGVDFVKVNSGEIDDRKEFSELPIEVSVRSGFRELEKFFAGIEHMGRLLRIDCFSLETEPASPYKITANFYIKGYIRHGSAPDRETDPEANDLPEEINQLLSMLNLVLAEDGVVREGRWGRNILYPTITVHEEKVVSGEEEAGGSYDIDAIELKGIVVSGDKIFALIDDITVGIGDEIYGAKIIDITFDKVVLRTASGKREIFFE